MEGPRINELCDEKGPNGSKARRYNRERDRSGNVAPSVDAATELLTKRGWVRADRLDLTYPIAQYWPEGGSIDFVMPLAIESASYQGPMIHLSTNKQMDLLVAPTHRCLLRNRKTHHFVEVPASAFRGDMQLIQAGRYAGGPVHLAPDEVSWVCAVQADGSYTSVGGLRFGLTKRRKRERLKWAMDGLGIHYTEDPKGFHIGVTNNRPLLNRTREWLGGHKQFCPRLFDWDRATLDVFAEEVFLWDGNETRRNSYASSDLENADMVMAVWALSGRRARMREYDNGNPNARICHIVETPVEARAYSLTTNLERSTVAWNGPIFGISVPSGYVVTRRCGKVAVTGDSSLVPARTLAASSA